MHSLDRRNFIKSLAGFGAMSLTINPYEMLIKSLAAQTPHARLSWKAYRNTDFQGVWTPTQIEGNIPSSLSGTLYRIGPGAKKNYSTPLNHFFDGDAFLTAIHFENGQLRARSQFINTEERKAEKAQGAMLYHEYGTRCPCRAEGFKNPPNINFVKIGRRHLALSEAAHPYLVRPEDLKTVGPWDFQGQLDKDLSFTAHPKFDPFSGDTFAYGISRSLWPHLKVFKIDQHSEKLTQIASVGLGGFYPVHDMLLTENYVIFIVPPLKINLIGAALGGKSVAELLEYDKTEALKIIVVRKDGQGQAVEMKSQPSGFVFHNCNAYEDTATGNLVLDSIISDDASAFELFKSWNNISMPKGPSSWITRFKIDLKSKKVLSRKKMTEGTPTDFPCIDQRMYGSAMNFYYSLEATRGPQDPLAMNQLVIWDLKNFQPRRVQAESSQIWGEPLFVPFPGSRAGDDSSAWIIHHGYDGQLDQTFLDIRSAIELKLISRIWFGRYLPLGFHGSFTT